MLCVSSSMSGRNLFSYATHHKGQLVANPLKLLLKQEVLLPSMYYFRLCSLDLGLLIIVVVYTILWADLKELKEIKNVFF